MKKLVFMALAAVFMVSSGFDVQSQTPYGDCTITYTETSFNMLGPVEIEHTFSISGLNWLECRNLQDTFDRIFK